MEEVNAKVENVKAKHQGNEEMQQTEWQVSGDTMSGRFSNQVAIAHVPEEFMLDFVLNSPTGTYHLQRVILTPNHAKRLSLALMKNIQEYEKKFGAIPEVIEPLEVDKVNS